MPFATPNTPLIPQTTPLSTRGALRAPIHNPYDKFSQSEFDAWIGDITGALRCALGQQEAPAKPSDAVSQLGDVSIFDEDVVEDSFAEVKARRAAKGKQRATDDDIEEHEEEDEVESSIIAQGSEDEAEEDEEELEYEEAVPSWHMGRQSWEDSVDELSGEEGEAEEDEEDPATTVTNEPIEISSDEDEDHAPLHSRTQGSPDELLRVSHQQDIRDSYETDDGEESDEASPDGEDPSDGDAADLQDGEWASCHFCSLTKARADFVPSDEESDGEEPPIDLPDNCYGPRTYAEDFYSGRGVVDATSDAHVLSNESGAECTDTNQADEGIIDVDTDDDEDEGERLPTSS